MTEIPEQNGGSSPASIPVKDRRLHPRQRVASLTYVDLGEDNGGIVLNVSEAGIRIQAAAALEAGAVSIRLQLPGTRKRLQVNAEVVWVGASRKEAGLRFVDLSEDALRQIRKWIAREESPEAFNNEDNDSETAAEPARTEPLMAEAVAMESATAVVDDEMIDDELVSEDEPVSEEEDEPDADADGDAETLDEVEGEDAPEEMAVETRLEAPEEESEPETAEEIETPIEAQPPIAARGTVQEAAAARIPEVRKPEPERAPAAFETAIPASAKTPDLPVSTFDGISGTHGAPSLGFTSPARLAPRTSPTPREAPLFVKPHRPAPASLAEDDGWKSYRVKLQSGWFVAALVLLLALISFVAGMAVRRGALNSVIGQSDEPVHPQTAPPTTGAPPASASSLAEPAGASAKPLEIEVVDSSGRRWEVPAASGANHPDTGAAHEAPTGESAAPASNDGAFSRRSSPPQSSTPDSSSAVAGADKPGAPLMLTLPETPVSASGSVAIRSRGEVPVPAGTAKSAEDARNLQIGQLMNLVEPVYPPEAQQHGVEGTVKLHAVIGVDGKIKSLEPRSGPEALIQAAMTAVRQWQYSPTKLNGKPIETQEDISFAFRLPK